MKKKLTIGLSALAMVAAGTAFALPGKGPDADGDGVVTKAEATAHAAQMFTKLDVNKDGKLDQADREARKAERKTKMFAAIDADSNGQISKSEFMGFEREGKRGQDGPGWHGRGDGDGDGPHGDGHHGKRGGHRGGMMMLKMADTNNDGAVSKAEFEAAHAKHFAMVDTNKDGKITQEERKAAREEMRAKFHEMRQQPAGE